MITIYSADQLDLPLGGTIAATRRAGFDGRWTYLYTGAVLLTYANDRWFLISQFGDDDYRPAVTVLRDTDRIQVETSRTLFGQ